LRDLSRGLIYLSKDSPVDHFFFQLLISFLGRYVPLQEPKGLKTEFSEGSVSVSADVPVKGVSLAKDGVEFEDNLFDLVPEETVTLKTKGWNKKDGDRDDVEIAYYVPGHRLNCQ
jgi:hypothetical protein